MSGDAARKDRLSFAIFWAMWKRQVSPPRLGKAIGKSADTIRRWRDGESAPSVLDVGPLADALGVERSYFTDPPEVPSYPFAEYAASRAEVLVEAAVEAGLEEGRRRARQPRGAEAPSTPERSPARSSR